MRISACYIVKNEEKTLPKSIESIKDSIDELIVVDTGSVDNTIAIAKSAGAQVWQVDWRDDFAWARNQALEHATGDWIIFLDADEYFSEETKDRIRETLEEQQEADVLFISMDNMDTMKNELLLRFYAPRIFKNNIGLSYHGKIHESIGQTEDLPCKSVMLAEDKLKLIHTGYSRDISLKKVERNLEMLKKELKDSEHPEELYGYLAECYMGLGMYNQVKKYAELDIAKGRRVNTYGSKSWRLLLDVAIKENNHDERKRIASDAVKNWPEIPEFHAEMAECYAHDRNYSKAIEEAELAERTYRNYSSLEPMKFTDALASLVKKRSRFWQQIIDYGENVAYERTQTINDLKKDIVNNIYLACIVIIKLSAQEGNESKQMMVNDLIKWLPDNFQYIMKHWQAQKMIDDEHCEAYIVILLYILQSGTQIQLNRYLQIIENISSKYKRKIAECLYMQEYWQEAWNVYSMLPQSASEVDGDFWLHAGICQYQMNNFIVAQECLDKAQEFLTDNAELKAYLTWNERQMNTND